MKLTGNTILITGGGSGIGRGLAEAFHQLGNQVIVVGRRPWALEQVMTDNPGMQAFPLDLDNPSDIQAFGQQMAARFPALNVLINNAGIQRPEDIRNPFANLAAVDAMVTTNLLGPIRLTAALLPHLMKKVRSTVMNVTSGLGFVPGAGVPTYSATKAALHAYTVSMRHQLKGTATEVIELIPPYVQTDLGPSHGTDPRAMPLADFITEVIAILRSGAGVKEVVVERCKHLRFAAEMGKFDATFTGLNGMRGMRGED